MYGYIYKITNILNNKIYIGKHKYDKNELDKSYICSGIIIKKAIKKYGIEKFLIDLIDVAESLKELNEKEKYYIKYFDCREPKGYNMTDGGDGAPNLSEESKKKLAYWKGKKQSSESQKKRSESLKKVVHTKEWCEKISKANKGQIVPESSRLISSLRHKNSTWYNDGIK